MPDPSALKAGEPKGINPEIKKAHDSRYSEDQHGSAPLDTVSVGNQGPAVWPVIWALATLILAAITLFLIFG